MQAVHHDRSLFGFTTRLAALVPTALPLAALSLAALPLAAALYPTNAAAQDAGEVPGSSTATLAMPETYGARNQHRLWFNSYANRWDALLPRFDSEQDSSQSDHYIVKDVNGAAQFTELELEVRDTARPDVAWDDATARLYVLSSHPTQTQYWRLSYDPANDEYQFSAGRGAAGAGVAVPGFTHPDTATGGDFPAALHLAGNGTLWASVLKAGQLLVQYSSDRGRTWLPAPANLNDLLVSDDLNIGLTDLVSFESDGDEFVGLFVAEDDAGNAVSEYFFLSIAVGDDPTIAANWRDESAAIPPAFGSERAAGDVSAVDTPGVLYFAVTTAGGATGDPFIKLFERRGSAQGRWFAHAVTRVGEVPQRSRPTPFVDAGSPRRLYVFVSDDDSSGETDGDSGFFEGFVFAAEVLAFAPFQPLFSAAGAAFADVSVPRRPVTTDSGVLALAHDQASRSVWAGSVVSDGTVLVPEIVGLPGEGVIGLLFNSELQPIRQRASSETVPEGFVVSVDPPPGTPVDLGAEVTFVVSTGPPPVFIAMPNVIGLTQSEAEAAVFAVGLGFDRIDLVANETVAAGTVIDQSPPPGESVRLPYDFVDLIVSAGANRAVVPDVLGSTRFFAELNITEAGLVVGAISVISSETVFAGEVISQSPPPGVAVDPGTAVSLVFSSGPELTVLPDVVDDGRAVAEQRIVDAGLRVGNIRTRYSKSVLAGRVTAQLPRGSGWVGDDFSPNSLDGNDGPLGWSFPWAEGDRNDGPRVGNVRVSGGWLRLDNRRKTGGEPSVLRGARLGEWTIGALEMSVRTSPGVDRDDVAVIEISGNGGLDWEVLETFTGIRGRRWFKRNYDVSRFLSNETYLRIRIDKGYDVSGERLDIGYVEINVEGRSVSPGSPIDLEVSRGPRATD